MILVHMYNGKGWDDGGGIGAVTFNQKTYGSDTILLAMNIADVGDGLHLTAKSKFPFSDVEFNLTKSQGGAVESIDLTINEAGACLVPLPSPITADSLAISLEFVGEFGNVELWVFPDTKTLGGLDE